jgi:hypothetical protein
VDKESDEYKTVMNSKSLQMQVFHIAISSRNDLTNDEIDKLFQIGNKDILINLAINHNLTESNKNEIIKKGTYLARKKLIHNHNLTDEQKELLLDMMKKHKNLYQDLINFLN